MVNAMNLSLTDLNDICLRHIFLRVSVPDRMALRPVSKRFRDIIDDSWSEVTKFTIRDLYNHIISWPDQTNHSSAIQLNLQKKGLSGTHNCLVLHTTLQPKSDQRLLEAILKRCGEFITTLIDYRHTNNCVFPVATEHCRKLERLTTSIRSRLDDKQLSQLLAVNPRLQALDLDVIYTNVNACFRAIPTEHLQELRIALYDMNPPLSVLRGQQRIIRDSPHLKKLEFDAFDDDMIRLVGMKTQLETLELYLANVPFLTQRGLDPILNLKNLRRLCILSPDIEGRPRVLTPVDDNFLEILAQNARSLQSFAIDAPANITDEGFAALASLPNLTALTIKNCERVTDQYLPLFYKLELLGVINCSVRDNGVIKLLEKSQTIRGLNLEGTKITNRTLTAAVGLTKKRTNGYRLDLYSTNTETAPWKLKKSSPYLWVIDENAVGPSTVVFL